MAVSLQLGLKQNQKLILTQSLKQGIELLQLSTIELSDRITEELLNNPVLEELEGSQAGIAESLDIFTEVNQNLSGDESAFDRAEERLAKYGDMGETSYSFSSEDDRKRNYLETVIAQVESLNQHLLWQAQMTAKNDREFALFESIITSLDENGFLAERPAAIAGDCAASKEMLESAIAKIRLFDPVGCAVSGVRESLLVQARHFYPDEPLMHRVIADYFSELENLNYEKIARGLNRGVSEVLVISKMIQGLAPFPAGSFRPAKRATSCLT
jgi:RNA polymerase sigma-54 factor